MAHSPARREELGMKNILAFVALAGQFAVLPLGMAAAGGTASVANALLYCDVEALSDALEQGASANWVRPESGESALHYAVGCESGMEGNQYGLVRLLVAAGAVVSAATVNGESVLERALLFGSEPTIELLLESGANAHGLTTMGVSMPALARIVGNASAERALRQYGAELSASDLEAVDQWGWIADFDRDIDRWMDRNAGLDGAEHAEALTGFLRGYFADQPELAAEFDLDPLGRTPTAYSQDAQCCGLAAPAASSADRPEAQAGDAGLSVSDCRQNCHDGYKSGVQVCGSGAFGVLCRIPCGNRREGCLNSPW